MTVHTFTLFLQKVRAKKVFRGFSLVEAMLGIFIISVVIGGPMVIAGRAAQDIRYSKEVFTATFLAEEAIELIRFKRDTMFLECSVNMSNVPGSTCEYKQIFGGTDNETTGEAAWRIFKEHFGQKTSTLCFSVEGCTFDTLSIMANPTIAPVDIYSASSTATGACNTLFQDKSPSLSGTKSTSALDFMYLCPVHKAPGSVDASEQRIVKMTSLTSIGCPSYDCTYTDDVKIDVIVNYNYRGVKKSITVTDFLKARP